MSIHSIRAARASQRTSRRPVPGAVAAVVALILFSLNLVPASAIAAPKLLILPIVVHSAEDPVYLRNGLADMLTARLARIGGIELVRPKNSEDGTTKLEQALEQGRKAGADYVLYGSFTRFGQGASLDVECSPTDASKARAPLREIFVHSGSIGEIIPDLDELAGKVTRFANGQNISPAAPAPSGFGITSPAAADLIARIEALEDALAEMRAANTDEAGN